MVESMEKFLSIVFQALLLLCEFSFKSVLMPDNIVIGFQLKNKNCDRFQGYI